MARQTVLKTLLMAGLLAVGVTAADAATYTFNFAESAPGTTQFTDQGLTVTVGAMGFIVGTGDIRTADPGTPMSVTNAASGLGILGGSDNRVNSSGDTYRELLNFSFTQTLRLVSMTVSGMNVVPIKQFFVFTDGTSDVTKDAYSLTGTGTATTTFPATLPEVYQSNGFGFGAKAGTKFYISQLVVSDDLVAAVPLPAGGLLLASVLVAPLLRRKRKAA